MRGYPSLKITLWLLFLIGVCFASVKGPKYYDLRSMGMGNTTVAVTTDRTAIFHNPAGLSLLKDKIDISISPLVMGIDGKFGTIVRAMAEQGDKLSDLANRERQNMETPKEETKQEPQLPVQENEPVQEYKEDETDWE